eukprot:6982552-Prymnesium_polylepis.1
MQFLEWPKRHQAKRPQETCLEKLKGRGGGHEGARARLRGWVGPSGWTERPGRPLFHLQLAGLLPGALRSHGRR